MNKRITANLGNVGTVKMCKRVLKEQTTSTGEIPFYKISTFGGNADCFISRSLFEDYKTRFSFPKKGDILISAAGTLGRTVVYNGEDAFFQDSNIVWIDNDEQKILNAYLYYFYQTNPWLKTHGSTIERLYNDDIRSIAITYPESLAEQKNIISSLMTIDEKISNNTAICSELEAMAKLLYDYWFVQFDFPDKNGKPYKSSGGKMVWNEELKRDIPDGWKAKKMKGFYQIEKGLSYSTEDIATKNGVPMINLACIDRSRSYRVGELKYHSGNVPDTSIINAGDLLIACTDLTREREIIGCPILVPDDGVKYTYSTDIAKISFPSAELDDMYMYMTLRTESYHDYIKAWASGTTVLHLNLQGLDWYGIVVPPIELQQRFARIIRSIHSIKSRIWEENDQLVSLRDFLLPMLMNGQVKIGRV